MKRHGQRCKARATKHADTYTAVPDPTMANGIANVLTDALRVITESDVPKQDIALALGMVFAVYVRRVGLVESEALKMIRMLMAAPLVELPIAKGDA